MKKLILLFIFIATVGFTTKNDSAFNSGERFVFKVSYGFLNAGYATLEVKEAKLNSKNIYHVIGKGYTTGMSRLFFKVNDTYESYIDKETGDRKSVV